MRSVQSHFPDNLNAPQTAQAAIGQYDVRATPLQMAIVAAAIANRGVVMDPYLVQQVRGPKLEVLDTHKPQLPRRGRQPADRVPAHRDDDPGRRGGHRDQRPDPRGPGGRQDRHRAAGRRAHPARVVHRPSRRPTPSRRSRSRSSSRTAATSRRSAATGWRPRSRRPSCGRCSRSDDSGHRPSARRPLPADGADRRRRHGRGVAGRGHRARAHRRREAAAPRVRRRRDVPRALPQRGAAHGRAVAPGHRAGLRLRRGHGGGGRVAVPRHGARARRAAVDAAVARGRALAGAHAGHRRPGRARAAGRARRRRRSTAT